ncbi:hypothetical protein LVB09_04670 [Francisella tularensis]|nr:hypothetical protein [Francisella tularensis]UJM49364.1 hypothetical protein LVB09_04670 [Francisella tularensis]
MSNLHYLVKLAIIIATLKKLLLSLINSAISITINRESANTRYTELQDQQRNVSSSINGNTSQGFDNDYNSVYEQYNNAMDSLQSSLNNSAVNVDRVDTYQGEDYNAHNFGQISDKFNSWQYRNI